MVTHKSGFFMPAIRCGFTSGHPWQIGRFWPQTDHPYFYASTQFILINSFSKRARSSTLRFATVSIGRTV